MPTYELEPVVLEKFKNISQPRDHGMVIEKDVKIPLRDGTIIFADIFRPDIQGEKFPAIMNISVYHKD